MIPRNEEKQIPVKLDDFFIGRLDTLAKRGAMNRHHLMLSFVNVWLNVLEKSEMSHVFYLALILRDLEAPLNGILRPQREFTESRLPEKPLPIKITAEDIFKIDCFANKANISRHQLMKNMIITGIEELEEATEHKPYQFATIEPLLHKSFAMIMAKGFKALKAGIK